MHSVLSHIQFNVFLLGVGEFCQSSTNPYVLKVCGSLMSTIILQDVVALCICLVHLINHVISPSNLVSFLYVDTVSAGTTL